MRRLLAALSTVGLTNIANAHTLDYDHSLARALWHQLSGGHHLTFTLGVLAGGIALYLIGRWIENHRS